MKKYIQLAVGLLISGIFIFLAFYWGGVTLPEILSALGKTNWLIAFAAMVVVMLGFYVRAFRWRILLGPVKDVSANRLFDPMIIGFGFNNIFPARLGEFARPLALKKQEDIPYATGLSTVVVERLIDSICLLIFLLLMPFYITLNPDISYKIGDFTLNSAWLERQLPKFSIIAFVLLCGVGSFLIPPVKNLYIKILHAMKFVPQGIRNKLEEIIHTVEMGFKSVKSPKALVLISIQSMVIWLSMAWSYQLISLGFPAFTLSFSESVAIMSILCVVVALPSSPGYWGVFEAGGVFALLIMGVIAQGDAKASSNAFAFTMVNHLIQWVPITLWGVWAARKLAISAHDAEEVAEETVEEGLDPDKQEESAI